MSFLNKQNSKRFIKEIIPLVLIFVTFLSCSTQQKIEETVPEWVNYRPKTDFYYIGIAKVDKKTHPTDFKESGKKIALAALASEISVKIESNSVLSTYENNNNFNSDYQQYIKTEINKDLSGFEMVEESETKRRYYTYYRLSKSKWRQIQAQHKTDAANKAFHWYEQANSEKEAQNFTIAIQYLLNGLGELKNYWGETVLFQNNNKTIQLDYLIKADLLKMLGDIDIKIDRSPILLNTQNHFSKTIDISIINKNNDLIRNVPFKIKYKKSTIPYQMSFFSSEKPSSINITDVDLNKLEQNFTIEIEKTKLLRISGENKTMLKFIYDGFNTKPIYIPIKIEMPKVFITINKTIQELNIPPKSHYLKDGIRTALNQKNINIVDKLKDSDLTLIITTHKTKGDNIQKFKQIYFGYTIVVKNTKTKKIIYTQDIPQRKSTDISFSKAEDKAYLKAADDFKYLYTKPLIKGILK